MFCYAENNSVVEKIIQKESDQKLQRQTFKLAFNFSKEYMG